ncbi:26S proteasome regulatory subunit (nucleomorph) [Cryptomonas paramecium]|uniref:26S proteasome regulatory subunit n=1 Tax=Cryptomonas paramaecium TaxID=2898 RepID=F2HIA6_9CRYP|nr:26S proteasome regulatory subunit [Cryptomonas paramecium]AEA39030.1 26S proteasome regulatory subunit [Cryptomonas paramecium]
MSFLKKYKLTKINVLFEKNHKKKVLKIYVKFWFEFLYNFTKKKYFYCKSNFLKVFQLKKERNKLISYVNQVSNKKEIRLPKNFIIVCIDEYINSRKKGLAIYTTFNKWSDESWRLLEILFEIVLIKLYLLKKNNLLLLLICESFRYTDILNLAFLRKNRLDNSEKLVQKLKKHFFNTLQYSYFYKLFKKSTSNTILYKFICSKLTTKCLRNFFIRKQGYICFLFRKFLKLNLKQKRTLLKFFFMIGLGNFDIFWLKSFSRCFLMILNGINYQILFRELFFNFFKKKKLNFLEINSSLRFCIENIKKKGEIHNLTKTVILITFNFLLVKFKNVHIFTNFLKISKYIKINTWLKFLAGYFFSFIYRRNFFFCQFFLDLIEKEWISIYLKNGILYRVFTNINFLNQYKELFIKKYMMFLEHNAHSNKHAEKEGFSSDVIFYNQFIVKDFSKEDFLQKLILNLTNNNKIQELLTLTFGMCYGEKPKYVLKSMLKVVNTIQNENTIRFIFTSLAILCKSKKQIAQQVFRRLQHIQNSIIKNGIIGIYALAFHGSSDLTISEEFLKYIFYDIDEDTKRIASLNLGFIFFSKFFFFEKIVRKLITHIDPFVRSGGAFAIGVSSFFNNSYTAIRLLKKLSIDKVDFVRQSSLISLALSVVKDKNTLRRKKIEIFFRKKMFDKTQNEIEKFGTILAHALIIGCCDFDKDDYICRVFLFIHYWYWIPCVLFIF